MVSINLEIEGLEFIRCIQVVEKNGSVELRVVQDQIPQQSIYFENENDF